MTWQAVAPLTGSVDRNVSWCHLPCTSPASLPSRGAWIEMLKGDQPWIICTSLPSRGAWIEMECNHYCGHGIEVAPLTGSVDRNAPLAPPMQPRHRRSPHGERG